MRKASVWLAISGVLLSIGMYVDQVSSACVDTCTFATCFQKKITDPDTGKVTTKCYYCSGPYYNDMRHTAAVATCSTPDTTQFQVFPMTCNAYCTGWGATTHRTASCSGSAGAPTLEWGCSGCAAN